MLRVTSLRLAGAAALTLGGAAAANAQPPGDHDRTVVRTTTVVHRDDNGRHDGNWNGGDRHDRGWHRGWNNNRGWHRGWDRGRHYGWNRHRRWGHGRTCRTIIRHHSRTRICRSW